ncbi:MAG: hypothetical protein MHM6MM_001349 [Cercozoa sp. M6MM]
MFALSGETDCATIKFVGGVWNKLAAFVRKRVMCAIDMVRRRGGIAPVQEWLPCVLVTPSLSVETPDYCDLFNDMRAVLLGQDRRMYYSSLLEAICARDDSLAGRNTAPFARLLVGHEVVEYFDFDYFVSRQCAHRLSLGGSLAAVMRRYTEDTINIQRVLLSVRSQPLSDWAHLLPFLEEGKGRSNALLSSLPELSKAIMSQCADASQADVDRALRVLRLVSRVVKLTPVRLWILDDSSRCNFRYSDRLRYSLHDLAQVLGAIPPVLSQRSAQLDLSCLQRLLLPGLLKRDQLAVVTSKPIQELHALMWVFVLSGITEVKTTFNMWARGGARDVAEHALVQDMLLQLVRRVTTRVEQDTCTVLLRVCDDVYGEGVVPVEVSDLIHSFVGVSRDNGLFAAAAGELMGSRFLGELVSSAVSSLLHVVFDSEQVLPKHLDLGVRTDSFRVMPAGSAPLESLLVRIEQRPEQPTPASESADQENGSLSEM